MFKVLRHIVRITALVAIMILIGPMSAITADASSVIVMNAPASVEKGDSFTVTVSFKGNDIGRVDGELSYDSSVISYVSGGSSSGDSGCVQLSEAGVGETISFKLKFKAVGSGTSKLNVSTNGIYNLEEEFIDAPSASNKIVVGGEEETTTEETTEVTDVTDVTEETTVTETTEEVQEDTNYWPLISLFAVAAAVILVMLIVIILVNKSRRNRRNRRY